ncbi:MAG: fluoride efflux transporter CrcB [Pseudomonadota bacterium]
MVVIHIPFYTKSFTDDSTPTLTHDKLDDHQVARERGTFVGIGLASIALVAVGGAIGGMARVGISQLAARWLGNAFPWGTLAVNLLGSFALGWLAATLTTDSVPPTGSYWLMIAVGLLGGFTTVSSFSLQTLGLWESGKGGKALANIITTVMFGVAALVVGAWLGGGL